MDSQSTAWARDCNARGITNGINIRMNSEHICNPNHNKKANGPLIGRCELSGTILKKGLSYIQNKSVTSVPTNVW